MLRSNPLLAQKFPKNLPIPGDKVRARYYRQDPENKDSLHVSPWASNATVLAVTSPPCGSGSRLGSSLGSEPELTLEFERNGRKVVQSRIPLRWVLECTEKKTTSDADVFRGASSGQKHVRRSSRSAASRCVQSGGA